MTPGPEARSCGGTPLPRARRSSTPSSVAPQPVDDGRLQFRNDIYNLDGLDVYAAQQTEIPL